MAPIARGRQTTRLETFVDAAFAASFRITVMFWLGHYRLSRCCGIGFMSMSAPARDAGPG